MRVLYLSRADEFRDKSSLVIIAKSILGHMLRDDPEMYVTWVVPKGTKDEVLDEYVLKPLGDAAPRMGFVKCMAGLSGRSLGYFLTEDVWYALTQTKVAVPYDVVLSNQLALTPIWHTVLTNRYQASRYAVQVPIVNWQMWTATHQQLAEVPEYYAGEPDVVAESLASLFATNVWESEVLYKAHLDTMKRYVQPSVLKQIKDQSHVMANGVDWPNLDAVFRNRESRIVTGDGPRLFWGGRLANQKKPRVTFPLMQKVATAVGLSGERVVISTNRPESDPDVDWCRSTFPDWALHTGVDRTGFFGLMAQGDVFLCNSPSESYGVAWLEMLATGMLGVFDRAWWNETLLPDWYPFVTDSADEQVAMATALLKQWPDGPLWTEYVPKVRAWIREEHNEVRSAHRLGVLLRSKKTEAMRDQRITPAIADLAVDAAWSCLHDRDQEGPIPEEEVWIRMSDLSDTHREFGKPGDLISRMYLRRLLETRGWRDVCRSRQVEFVPPEGAP